MLYFIFALDSIKTALDRYVYVLDESLVNIIRRFKRTSPPVIKRGAKGVVKYSERQKPL